MKWIKEGQKEFEWNEGVFKTIDFAPLEEKVSEVLGVPVELTAKFDPKALKVSSRNLVDSAGIFHRITDKVIVVSHNEDIDLDKGYIYLLMILLWEFSNRTPSSMELLRAWYDLDTRQWEFESLL